MLTKAILSTILFIGTVDSIEDSIANIEITASNNEIYYGSFPLIAFPCKIKEKDLFYFIYTNDTVEIRCGEPPI